MVPDRGLMVSKSCRSTRMPTNAADVCVRVFSDFSQTMRGML